MFDSIIIEPREFHFLSIQNIFENLGWILVTFYGGSYLWLYGCYDRITHRPKARTNCQNVRRSGGAEEVNYCGEKHPSFKDFHGISGLCLITTYIATFHWNKRMQLKDTRWKLVIKFDKIQLYGLKIL